MPSRRAGGRAGGVVQTGLSGPATSATAWRCRCRRREWGAGYNAGGCVAKPPRRAAAPAKIGLGGAASGQLRGVAAAGGCAGAGVGAVTDAGVTVAWVCVAMPSRRAAAAAEFGLSDPAPRPWRGVAGCGRREGGAVHDAGGDPRRGPGWRSPWAMPMRCGGRRPYPRRGTAVAGGCGWRSPHRARRSRAETTMARPVRAFREHASPSTTCAARDSNPGPAD